MNRNLLYVDRFSARVGRSKDNRLREITWVDVATNIVTVLIEVIFRVRRGERSSEWSFDYVVNRTANTHNLRSFKCRIPAAKVLNVLHGAGRSKSRIADFLVNSQPKDKDEQSTANIQNPLKCAKKSSFHSARLRGRTRNRRKGFAINGAMLRLSRGEDGGGVGESGLGNHSPPLLGRVAFTPGLSRWWRGWARCRRGRCGR